MNKYTELSDFEVNKKVVEKLGIACECDMGTVIIYRDSECHAFDPCNNIEQAWEIMMKYNICVTKEPSGGYVAFNGLVVNNVDDADWFYYETHPKPLVAAMLCFLEL